MIAVQMESKHAILKLVWLLKNDWNKQDCFQWFDEEENEKKAGGFPSTNWNYISKSKKCRKALSIG